jgi:hypothetical protein
VIYVRRRAGQRKMSVGSGNLRFQCQQWLIEVGRKLGREEFQLLKALYLKTLPLGTLQDDVMEPQDHAGLLCDLPSERSAAPGSAAATRGRVGECDKLTSLQSLALFAHRLQILVPTSDILNEDDTRNLGAKDAISSLQNLLGTLPTVEEIEISEESRLAECLVKSYINMKPLQRGELKRRMAEFVGLNVEMPTIFDVFAELFVKKYAPKEIVMKFASSMRLARCYKSAYSDLKGSLVKYDIPHHEILIPGK